jgi:hypothetical protein
MENYFRTQQRDSMSIQAAVTRGLIYRGTDKGTVVIGGIKMKASAAVDAGMIDQKAADYVTSLPGTNEPAAHARKDAAPPPEEIATVSAMSTIDALGAFFTNPTLLNKQIASKAIDEHFKAAQERLE